MSPPSNDTATADSPIARIALFQGLSAKSLARVASIATEQRYPVGTVLFRAGDVGDRLYLITEGRVRISREVPGMGEEALTILGPGDYFGEMAVIDPAPRSADAHVHESCTVLEITKNQMEHLMLVHRDLAYEVLWNVVRTLTARLRDTTDKVTFMAVTGRFT